jgi:hypothetical protein
MHVRSDANFCPPATRGVVSSVGAFHLYDAFAVLVGQVGPAQLIANPLGYFALVGIHRKTVSVRPRVLRGDLCDQHAVVPVLTAFVLLGEAVEVLALRQVLPTRSQTL